MSTTQTTSPNRKHSTEHDSLLSTTTTTGHTTFAYFIFESDGFHRSALNAFAVLSVQQYKLVLRASQIVHRGGKS